MTRDREIELEAERNTTNQLELEGFIKGVRWADQHPKKGLWDFEKVCNFIEDNVNSYVFFNNDWNAAQFKCKNFIEDLKKAIED